jgi:ketosteroid isomerase-like protein
MRKAGFLIIMALLAWPASALAQADEYSKTSLKDMTPKWQAAYNAGDAAGLAALYAKDGSTELTVKDVHSMGESAAEVGMWVGTGADGSHEGHGHYTLIYEKVDGRWQIASDMWNSDMSQ